MSLALGLPRDKNLARRRTCPDAEWRPKARLVVAGHCDPDIQSGALRTDSPTVSRTAVMCILQIAAARLDQGWTAAAGDVTAAFLNGDALGRRLYLKQPKHGLPGLHPSQLIAIEKGVFGLVDSPRVWWKRFRKTVQEHEIELPDGTKAKFFNSPLDPCVFQLMAVDSDGNMIQEGVPAVLRRGARGRHPPGWAPATSISRYNGNCPPVFPVEEWGRGYLRLHRFPH